MGLFELADDGKIIGEYSKGMRKRVAMAASSSTIQNSFSWMSRSRALMLLAPV